MKNYIATFGRIIIKFLLSTVLGFLATFILDIPIKLIFEGDANIISFISGSVLTVLIMMFVFYNDGYQYQKYEPGKIIVSLIFILIITVVFIGSVKVSSFLTGPTIWLTNYIFHTDFQTQDISTYVSNIVLFSVAFVFVYSPIILIFENLGIKGRIKAREEFLREQREHPAINEKH